MSDEVTHPTAPPRDGPGSGLLGNQGWAREGPLRERMSQGARGLLAAVLLGLASAVGAQDAGEGVAQDQGQEQATADQVRLELAELLRQGRHDELIVKATEYLKQAQEEGKEADQTVQYLRGRAAYLIAWYGLAESDLTPLGDFSPWEKWEPASEYADRIPQIRRLAPAHVREMRHKGACVFRIYYDEADPWVDTVMETLPRAYRAVCELYGVDLAETAVFVFPTGPRYNEFMRVVSDSPPTDWQWAGGTSGVLMFCERDAEGNVFPEPFSDYFVGSVAHEFSHCLLRRYLGTVQVPPWLDEGLAMWCGALLVPTDFDQNDQQIAGILQAGTELTLRSVSTWDGFYKARNQRAAYAQAFAMTRYLASQIGRDGAVKLLMLLREEEDVDRAFQRGWNVTSQQFYGQWRQASLELVEAGALGGP